MPRKKILHIITGLNIGGAELMLLRLITHPILKEDFEFLVLSLSDLGPIADNLQKAGIQVKALNLNKSFKDIFKLNKFFQILNTFKPEIIHCWMYHANLFGCFSKLFFKKIPLLWSIHNTTFDFQTVKTTTVLISKISAFLSSLLPDQIICCAQSSIQSHSQDGYCQNKMLFIPNGTDTNLFKKNPLAKEKICAELNINSTELLIGLIARYDPQKDHKTFIEAAKQIIDKCKNSSKIIPKFILCGKDINWFNKNLQQQIGSYNRYFHLIGLRQDIPDILSSLDIYISSSYREAFPLILGEAMACELPCIATDVGDSQLIINSCGWIISPQNPKLLANTVLEVLEKNQFELSQIGRKARERIIQEFSLENMAKLYKQLYTNNYSKNEKN